MVRDHRYAVVMIDKAAGTVDVLAVGYRAMCEKEAEIVVKDLHGYWPEQGGDYAWCLPLPVDGTKPRRPVMNVDSPDDLLEIRIVPVTNWEYSVHHPSYTEGK